jgi:hypothetical protein
MRRHSRERSMPWLGRSYRNWARRVEWKRKKGRPQME